VREKVAVETGAAIQLAMNADSVAGPKWTDLMAGQ
jgi:hypothetical protein